MTPSVLGQNCSAAAAVLVLNLLGALSFKGKGKGFTALPDVHRHSGGQAEESRIALLPKARKEDCNIQEIQDTGELYR